MSDWKTFGEFCKNARIKSGHTGLSVQRFSEEEAKRFGEEFKINHSTVSRIEKGEFLPSAARLVIMARAYRTPVMDFLRILGVETSDVCSHQNDAQPLSESELYPPDHAKEHQMLERILARGGKRAEWIREAVKYVGDQVEEAAKTKKPA